MTSQQKESILVAHRRVNETLEIWCSEENLRNPNSEKAESDWLVYAASVNAVNELMKGYPNSSGRSMSFTEFLNRVADDLSVTFSGNVPPWASAATDGKTHVAWVHLDRRLTLQASPAPSALGDYLLIKDEKSNLQSPLGASNTAIPLFLNENGISIVVDAVKSLGNP